MRVALCTRKSTTPTSHCAMMNHDQLFVTYERKQNEDNHGWDLTASAVDYDPRCITKWLAIYLWKWSDSKKKPRARPACTYSPPWQTWTSARGRQPTSQQTWRPPPPAIEDPFRNQNRAPWKKGKDNALRPKKNKNKKIKKLKFQIPEHEKKKQKQKKPCRNEYELKRGWGGETWYVG